MFNSLLRKEMGKKLLKITETVHVKFHSAWWWLKRGFELAPQRVV